MNGGASNCLLSNLSCLAGHINAAFAQMDTGRILAGRLLLEAKRRVESGEAGNVTWGRWLSQNVARSRRDVNKVMALAASPDPIAALHRERAKAREGMVRARAQAQTGWVNVSPAAPASDEEALQLAVRQAGALRETLLAIDDCQKRARGLRLVDKCLADVRDDIARRGWRGELRPKTREARAV